MFLFGHSCWSYLASRATSRKLKVDLSLYLAFLARILPDFDVYFQTLLGYPLHHTYTHSPLVLGPISLVLAYRFRRLGVAFSTGLLSHLLTDGIVGTVPLPLPVSTMEVGLHLGVPLLWDILLELGALGVVLIYIILNRDWKQLRHSKREGLKLSVPLFAIVSLSLIFAGDNNIHLIDLAFSRKALTAISVGHIILGAIFAIGIFQGLGTIYREGHRE